MELLSGGKSLERRLTSLCKKYDNISLAVAWASAGTKAFESLVNNKHKIKNCVIGTHFYQTHPEVLEKFVGFEACRFVLQPEGVFHPKAFLFWSDNKWELLIGSANLTKGALSKNSELLVHITSHDASPEMKYTAEQIIEEFWSEGEVVTREKAVAYRAIWQTQQRTLKRISGTYRQSRQSTSPINTAIMTMPWNEYFASVKLDPHHGFEERCDLLEFVNERFSARDSFAELSLDERRTIAGLRNKLHPLWGWFGAMDVAARFAQKVKNNDQFIAEAIDQIPLGGIVSRAEYDAYIDSFMRAFPNGGAAIGVTSRLLALKRPDQFVCLDSKNQDSICDALNIKRSGMTFDRYWDDVICRIMDSAWWNAPKPEDQKEARVWSGRVAMLDAIYYQP
ncbi:hypothetical protein W04_3554 [Pseudoalteromonas sp. SW0106-04]|nr:hypothetical protein W04_3554 [Pseudoalteromonas sp. SW0106-04]